VIPEKVVAKIRIEECSVHDLAEDCWNYYGATNVRGYATAYIDGQPRKLHRYMYEVKVGDIPDRMELDHLCQTKRCVNPAHMEPVTGEVNRARITNPPYRLKTMTEYEGWKRFNERFLPDSDDAEQPAQDGAA
jgi:hypothetical protein